MFSRIFDSVTLHTYIIRFQPTHVPEEYVNKKTVFYCIMLKEFFRFQPTHVPEEYVRIKMFSIVLCLVEFLIV